LKPWYGHYCGPGQDPGRQVPYNDLDAGCQEHDDCYRDARLSAEDVGEQKAFGFNLKLKTCPQYWCDAALCEAARNFEAEGPIEVTAKIAVMKIFCYPDLLLCRCRRTIISL
jgi:hypothetical protein